MKKYSVFFAMTLLLYSCIDVSNVPPPPAGYERANDYGVSVEVTPGNGPITFSYDGDKIKASYKLKYVTYLGTFALKVSRTLYEKKSRPFYTTQQKTIPERIEKEYKFEGISLANRVSIHDALIGESDLIFGIIKDDSTVDIFKIPRGMTMVVILEGKVKVIVNKAYYTIDIRNSKLREIKLIEEESLKFEPKIADDHPGRNLILEKRILQKYELPGELEFVYDDTTKVLVKKAIKETDLNNKAISAPY